MKRMLKVILISALVASLFVACQAMDSSSVETETPNDQNNDEVFITNSYGLIQNEDLKIRWGDGTLFIITDEKIISDYLSLISAVEYKSNTVNDTGYSYFINYNNMTLNSAGKFNDIYTLKDLTIIDDISQLLHDYLPAYEDGKLEFQSDLMPDSHLYIVVKVEKNQAGKLYFVKHQNDYGFVNGSTETTQSFTIGDLVEIETDGRLPEGETIDIKSYSIKPLE